MYWIKSPHDFGQGGLVFETKYCAAIWMEDKFGKEGAQQGLSQGRYSIETVQFVYYPTPRLRDQI